MPVVTIDLWSDVVCPWCWIGKHRIQNALSAAGIQAEWRFHAFELGPRSQKRGPVLAHLAEKYGVSAQEAREMVGKVQGLGAELGIDINPDKQGTAQTFDAHRMVKAAESAGLGAQMVERLHRAHFTEGLDVGDKAVLRVLAGEAGMDPEQAAQVLDSDAYAREVGEDEQRARDYEISGVPFTVVNGRYAVGGAQSEKAFRKVLEEAVKNA